MNQCFTLCNIRNLWNNRVWCWGAWILGGICDSWLSTKHLSCSKKRNSSSSKQVPLHKAIPTCLLSADMFGIASWREWRKPTYSPSIVLCAISPCIWVLLFLLRNHDSMLKSCSFSIACVLQSQSPTKLVPMYTSSTLSSWGYILASLSPVVFECCPRN